MTIAELTEKRLSLPFWFCVAGIEIARLARCGEVDKAFEAERERSRLFQLYWEGKDK